MTYLLSLAIASALVSPASDYFPLVPGTKWTYQESGERTKFMIVDEVKAPSAIGGRQAFPIVSTLDGRLLETRYYRIEGDTVLLVAFDKQKPLTVPHPILKVGDHKTVWEFTGVTPFMNSLAEFAFKADSERKGKRSILGREAECVEVRINGIVDGGGGTKLESRQTAVYAKGIGLVEMRERRVIARNTVESTVRLVQFEAPSPSP